MKITEDVRKYAAEHGLIGCRSNRRRTETEGNEFTKAGSEIYAKA